MRFRALSVSANSKRVTAHLCVCVAVLFAWASPAPVNRRADPPAPHRATEEEIDAALQRAATLALGGRDGTIVVMDAQTGRVRAAVNGQLAAEGAYPPGSAVKPFTLLAALRKGIVGADTRLLCRKHYKRGATEFTCAHPVYKTLFDTAHALAHSCNYFFAHLGERLTTEDFDATLAPFGFGAAGGANDATAHDSPTRNTASRRAASREVVRLAHRTTPKRAGADVEESGPRLPRGEWRTEDALGEGGAILVTPLQLIAAYAALANGGHLFEPRRDAPANYQPSERARLSISDEERAVIVAGMRGAVSYGTAERARLDALPSRVFGKTGTATEVGGFRTHGWFVGLASDPRDAKDRGATGAARGEDERDATGADEPGVAPRPPSQAHAVNEQPAPTEVRLAVLVFLKRSQGKDCAEIARPVFEEYARLAGGAAVSSTSEGEESAERGATAGGANGSPVGVLAESLDAADARAGSSSMKGDGTVVRVRLARDGETVSMPLGEYLFGVLAAEGSTEGEYNAIKALAVVARTYALNKLGRHAREGFDFCTTTHCERYLRVTASDARPDFHALLRRAVAETEGQVLRDSRGHLANAYFSASCGGMTADAQTLWGEPAREPFERGVPDEYCAALPQTRWTDAIPARDLLTALRADPRSDVGSRLDSITVLKRDATGRAEIIALAGERRKLLRGWDFKIIVGRTLGWSVVKSSRFSVERAGPSFVFRGTGFGHGLGLCQAGAHVMARGGSSYLQILAHYFPGASVGRLSGARRADDALTCPHDGQQNAARWKADATAPLPAVPRLRSNPQARLTLAGEHFRVSYPARADRRAAESVLRTLEDARADIARRLDAASLPQPSLPSLEINVNETTAAFVAATGQPPWAAAATRGQRVELQPVAALERRGVLAQTLRHEYAHAVIDALSRGRAPLWLAEGLAAHFAGEGAMLSRRAPAKRMSVEEIERGLAGRAAPEEMRALYAAAYAEVRLLIHAGGEARLWRRVAGE
jgi:stage II sporulation protein D